MIAWLDVTLVDGLLNVDDVVKISENFKFAIGFLAASTGEL